MTTKGAQRPFNLLNPKERCSRRFMTDNLDKLIARIREIGDLDTPASDPAYEYASLPQCVIDAVFSIGARYESTQNAVKHFCDRQGWRKDGRGLGGREHTITEFVEVMLPYESRWRDMAVDLFSNEQLTSTTSGILKAEAVFRFATTLQQFGIEIFVDAMKSGLRDDLRSAIKNIHGQSSGLSHIYFLILAGNQDGVKGDRMVTRFVADALDLQRVTPAFAEELVRAASLSLRAEFPRLMPSVLDNKIWTFQRKRSEAGSAKKSRRTCITSPCTDLGNSEAPRVELASCQEAPR
jgi:hypothetical protein